MAIVAWATVVSGTFIVYPWYRAAPPQGADLTAFPRSLLPSKPTTAQWHNLGMESKEHVGWLAPIAATAEAIAAVGKAFTWYNPVGPLSGKVGVALIIYVVAWIVLHTLW